MALGDYLLGQWLPARESAIAETTYARYVTSVNHYLVPHLGHVQLRQLRADHLTTLYRQLALSGGHRGRPLAAKTILNLHQLLRLALEDAVDKELIAHNPADQVRPPDPRKRPSPRRRATSWTARELGAFLHATASSRHRMLFRLAAATGMRRGEILGLRWSDVHLDTGRLEITQALTAIGYQTSFSRLKTKTSRRCITLDPDTLKDLKAGRSEQAEALEQAGLVNQLGLVFTGNDGGPFHPQLASQRPVWWRLRLDLGAGSKAYRSGVATRTISETARAAGVSPDTLRYYERLGLLYPEDRSAAGYRLYNATIVPRVRFIKGAQRMRLRLSDIADLLDVRDRGDCPCGYTRRLVHQRLADVDQQLRQLSELREQLAEMLTGLDNCTDTPNDGGWPCETTFTERGGDQP